MLSPAWLVALPMVIGLSMQADPVQAASRRRCRAECVERTELECGDLSRRRLRKCRQGILRACRKTGLDTCLVTTTTTTTTLTATSTDVPETTTTAMETTTTGVTLPSTTSTVTITLVTTSTASPTTSTTFPCGDGILQPPFEQCDDGGNVSGDGCTQFCELQPVYDGGGIEQADCALQWGAATSDASIGATLTCQDGLSPCDRGPSGDQSCRFLVYLCMNNPSFVTACTWTGVSRVELTGASLSGPTMLDDAEQTSVLGAFVTALEWGGATVSGANPVREAVPTVTNGILCGQFALDVASGTARSIAVQLTDGSVAAHEDVDELTLVCEP